MAGIGRICCVVTLVLYQIFLCQCGIIPTKQKKDKGQTVDVEKNDKETETHPPVVKKGLNFKLKNDERCKEDITDFCAKEAKAGGNYDVLLCLQNQIKEDDLSEECHQALWEYKSKLVHDPQFEEPATFLCKEDISKLEDCRDMKPGAGDLVPCLVENRDGIKDTRCKHIVGKLSQILFTDYHLLKKFYKDCKDDVIKFECGRLDHQEKDDLHTQSSTLDCLEEQEANLTSQCRFRILRVAELQSEDYHMNRALYYACQEDRERLCQHVQAGEGRVYNCLMKRKFDEKMSEECRRKLTKKQKVEAKDYKANFPFLDSCKKAIEDYNCAPKGGSPTDLAKVLLCLETAVNDGENVGGTCQAHMKEVQEQLMEDYSINPAVVAHCEMEIKTYCGKVQKGGKTIDCLMEKAMEKEDGKKDVEFSKQCYEAVSELLKETGAGGDFKIDATLRETCRLSAQELCPQKGKTTDVSTLSCLMENLNHNDMAVDCKEQLMHLQFFLARDFKLDQVLYRVCKADAQKICSQKDMEDPDKNSLPAGMTLACLYRHILPNRYAAADMKVSKPCAAEVMRTMHQRASDVRLLPQIQHSCLSDLATHCTNKVERGEEIKCLQDNYEKLNEKCKKSIEEFTEEEGEDIDLDKSMVKHCTAMAKEFCKEIMENNDADGVLPCLYKHKYDQRMDAKCRAELEHRQLIELEDYRFSSQFKEACKNDVKQMCSDKTTKPEVIECLSKNVRNAIVHDQNHVISSKCRSQLRVEKLRQAEDIKFDPKLYGACAKDVEKYCKNEHDDGPAAVLECLKRQEELSRDCKNLVFEREKAEAVDKELDVRLFKVCKAMIKKFCMGVRPDQVLDCLKKHKRDMDTDEKCKEIVFTRQKIALKDLDLSPELAAACKKDVSKFCHGSTNNDQIIPCLKKHINDLSEQCEEYIAEIEEEAALDYRLNPALAKACKTDIDKLCTDKEPGHGEIMECLKDKYKEIKNNKCKAEIKEALVEERTDIMADPVLHEACARMVSKFCEVIHHGKGRVLQCLLQALDDGKIRSKECRNVLKSRRQMWGVMEIPGPESISDLAAVVSSSPQRNYFFIVFTCVLAAIFIGGIVSGRLSKRIARDAKNR